MTRKKHIMFLAVLLVGVMALTSVPLHDAMAKLTAPVDDTCTNSAAFNPDNSGTPGLVTTLVNRVQNQLNTLASNLFTNIVADSKFQKAIGALLLLYVAIYGASFAFGMANETVYSFTVRLIKISIIVLLITNGGSVWTLFYENVVVLFNSAVDELINTVTSAAIAGTGAPSPGTPLYILDDVINKVFSSKMIANLFAMFKTGWYGAAHVVLMALALYSLAGTFLLAIWIYLMSLVMRTLLFGLAPLFLAFMLFERTKPIFLGWINQIIAACLQPIFLFTFLSFFLILINSTIDSILSVPVCWTEMADTARGNPFSVFAPSFALEDPNNPGRFVKYFGDTGPEGPDPTLVSASGANKEPFPIDLLAVLTFFILTQLAGRFGEVVILVARDIASGAANLYNMQSGIQSFFTPGNTTPAGTANVTERVGPTGRTGPVSDSELTSANRTANQVTRRGREVLDRAKSAFSDLASTRDKNRES